MEQYEYMKGPNNAVGLKLLLHHQDDVPLVQDFGDNVPAGMPTFVSLSVTNVSTVLLVLAKHPHNLFLELCKNIGQYNLEQIRQSTDNKFIGIRLCYITRYTHMV